MGGKEAYIWRDTEFRVGQRAWEGSHYRGFVGVIAVQVGGFDLQGDVFLVAQLDHGDTVLPVTATINSNNKAHVGGFCTKKTPKTCMLLQFEWNEAFVFRCQVTVAIRQLQITVTKVVVAAALFPERHLREKAHRHTVEYLKKNGFLIF